MTRADKPGRLPLWWNHGDLLAWLGGRPVQAPTGRKLELARRLQAHVGIRPEELTSDEGILFSNDVLETLEPQAEWAVGVEALIPGNSLLSVGTLGSDARPIRIEPLPERVFDPPQDLLAAFEKSSAGVRLVVVTPACFGAGWLPDGLIPGSGHYQGKLPVIGNVILRAAFVPRPTYISGWDMARCRPKATASMVAAGAVYFFERVNGHPFTPSDARALWLAALGRRTVEGFGRVVPGVWNPKRKKS
jgi:CRISPR-associated protein Cmr3